jgi:hypothetical protein
MRLQNFKKIFNNFYLKKDTFVKFKQILFLFILSVSILFLSTEASFAKKKGIVSKVKDAAVRGFGWQLGKAARGEYDLEKDK